jgi:hypothetical protein
MARTICCESAHTASRSEGTVEHRSERTGRGVSDRAEAATDGSAVLCATVTG